MLYTIINMLYWKESVVANALFTLKNLLHNNCFRRTSHSLLTSASMRVLTAHWSVVVTIILCLSLLWLHSFPSLKRPPAHPSTQTGRAASSWPPHRALRRLPVPPSRVLLLPDCRAAHQLRFTQRSHVTVVYNVQANDGPVEGPNYSHF